MRQPLGAHGISPNTAFSTNAAGNAELSRRSRATALFLYTL